MLGLAVLGVANPNPNPNQVRAFEEVSLMTTDGSASSPLKPSYTAP